ncbi:hypothetical protein A0H81_09751 [Grifola frondosa]|uniref:Uncharacterized protein n=1 Tax=Grifola frondosa TaxID=5627 RepID=A0A1C7LZZ3_GRIFR|nr:hypothetical protein A0H81_09751 [Grifola frondosa]
MCEEIGRLEFLRILKGASALLRRQGAKKREESTATERQEPGCRERKNKQEELCANDELATNGERFGRENGEDISTAMQHDKQASLR